ncbi:MAG: glycosyl transferase [Acidobacteriota bacterium]
MHSFCTLFDSFYLSRGLALYRSLERTCPAFHLYIFAFDERSLSVLRHLELKHATVIGLSEFEDARLLDVKPSRTRAEYCWTSTSSTILYVLEHYDVSECTYIDADMMFFASPEPLFEEMGGASIMITEHRYTPRYDKSRQSGKYCVQFVTFKKDERGLAALRWWRERCLEWCYDRHEDGKFGDQKYLDDWPARFTGVHVMQHLGGGMAAWNVQQYDVFHKSDGVYARELTTGREFRLIFYHFHYLRFLADNRIELGRRILSPDVLSLIYTPYIRRLFEAKKEIARIDDRFDPNGIAQEKALWKRPILYVYRKALGIYNIFDIQKFLV